MLGKLIVADIQRRGGRFLRFESKQNGWVEIGDDRAVERTFEALRRAVRCDARRRRRSHSRRRRRQRRRREKEGATTASVESQTRTHTRTQTRGPCLQPKDQQANATTVPIVSLTKEAEVVTSKKERKSAESQTRTPCLQPKDQQANTTTAPSVSLPGDAEVVSVGDAPREETVAAATSGSTLRPVQKVICRKQAKTTESAGEQQQQQQQHRTLQGLVKSIGDKRRMDREEEGRSAESRTQARCLQPKDQQANTTTTLSVSLPREAEVVAVAASGSALRPVRKIFSKKQVKTKESAGEEEQQHQQQQQHQTLQGLRKSMGDKRKRMTFMRLKIVSRDSRCFTRSGGGSNRDVAVVLANDLEFVLDNDSNNGSVARSKKRGRGRPPGCSRKVPPDYPQKTAHERKKPPIYTSPPTVPLADATAPGTIPNEEDSSTTTKTSTVIKSLLPFNGRGNVEVCNPATELGARRPRSRRAPLKFASEYLQREYDLSKKKKKKRKSTAKKKDALSLPSPSWAKEDVITILCGMESPSEQTRQSNLADLVSWCDRCCDSNYNSNVEDRMRAEEFFWSEFMEREGLQNILLHIQNYSKDWYSVLHSCAVLSFCCTTGRSPIVAAKEIVERNGVELLLSMNRSYKTQASLSLTSGKRICIDGNDEVICIDDDDDDDQVICIDDDDNNDNEVICIDDDDEDEVICIDVNDDDKRHKHNKSMNKNCLNTLIGIWGALRDVTKQQQSLPKHHALDHKKKQQLIAEGCFETLDFLNKFEDHQPHHDRNRISYILRHVLETLTNVLIIEESLVAPIVRERSVEFEKATSRCVLALKSPRLILLQALPVTPVLSVPSSLPVLLSSGSFENSVSRCLLALKNPRSQWRAEGKGERSFCGAAFSFFLWVYEKDLSLVDAKENEQVVLFCVDRLRRYPREILITDLYNLLLICRRFDKAFVMKRSGLCRVLTRIVKSTDEKFQRLKLFAEMLLEELAD